MNQILILKKYTLHPLLRQIISLLRSSPGYVLLLLVVTGLAYYKYISFLIHTPLGLDGMTPVYILLLFCLHLAIQYFQDPGFYEKELIFFHTTPQHPFDIISMILFRQMFRRSLLLLAYFCLAWPFLLFALHLALSMQILFYILITLLFLRAMAVFQMLRLGLHRFKKWLLWLYILNFASLSLLFLFQTYPLVPLLSEAIFLILNRILLHPSLQKNSPRILSCMLLAHKKKKTAEMLKKRIVRILSWNNPGVRFVIHKYFNMKNLGYLVFQAAVVAASIFLYAQSGSMDTEEASTATTALLILFNISSFMTGQLILDTIQSIDLYRYRISPVSFTRISLQEILSMCLLYLPAALLLSTLLILTQPLLLLTAIPSVFLLTGMGWYLRILFPDRKLQGEFLFGILFLLLMIAQVISPLVFCALAVLIFPGLMVMARQKYNSLEF